MYTTTTIHLTPSELKELIMDCISESKAKPKMMRLKEAAEYLGISSTTLYRHATSGKIKAGRAGAKIWNFRKQDLDDWVEGNKSQIKA